MVDLRKVGAHVYGQHPTTDVWVAVFILEDGAGNLSEPIVWKPGARLPTKVVGAIGQGATVSGHNAAFEQAIDRHIMGPRYGFPLIPDEFIDCTMARCAIQALPLDLDRACQALGLKHQKDKAGHRLMLQMCKPRRLNGDGSAVWWDEPDKIARLTDYCAQDVRAEIGLGRALRPMPDAERAVWLLDQKINNRGVTIDANFVTVAARVAAATAARLDRDMAAVSGGAVEKATQVDRIKDFARAHGVVFKTIEKTRRNGEDYEAEQADREALEDLLAGELPAPVRSVFETRLAASKSSVKKLAKFDMQRCADGRARGTLQYHAASPGRWAGRGIQLQNLRRDGVTGKLEKAYGGWDAAMRDLAELGDETLELVWGPPLDLISRMLRGAVIAAPGCKLVFADYAQIEARGSVWAAGQQDMVDLFASDGKIYEEMAAFIFSLSVDEVIAGHESKSNIVPRFVGKEAILGCGYGVGPDAFARNCKKKGKIILDYTIAFNAVHGWRERNPHVVDFWRELEDAARHAIEAPGSINKAGPFAFRVKGNWLQCRLPSGRIMWYRRPSIEPKAADLEACDDGETVPNYRHKIHYWGVNGMTKQWAKESTWGGKILENCIQGMCRDLLAGAMLKLEAANYPIVLSVHDEAISEVPINFGSPQEFVSIMTDIPAWARGLPVKAEGGQGARYAKG